MTVWAFADDVKARIVVLAGAHNFRNMGGWTSIDGRVVRNDRIYRSAVLSNLTDGDYQRLGALGFTDLVDLRSDAEQQKHPTRWPESSLPWIWAEAGNGAQGNLLEVLDNSVTRLEDLREAMLGVYRRLPSALAAAYRHILQTLLEDRGALLFHCAAGKDRTGVAGAVILRALDVEWEQILLDYLLTNETYDLLQERSTAEFQLEELERRAPGSVCVMFGAHEEFLVAAFDAIDREYGDFAGYLRDAMGIDEVARVRLKAVLLR